MQEYNAWRSDEFYSTTVAAFVYQSGVGQARLRRDCAGDSFLQTDTLYFLFATVELVGQEEKIIGSEDTRSPRRPRPDIR